MGGVHGYGRVEPEESEPVFHSEWEGRVFGLVTTVRGGFSRRKLEALEPELYLSGYYQRWMIAFERGLIERGLVSEEELEAKTEHFRANPEASPTQVVDPDLTERVREGMYRQRQEGMTPPRPPSFAIGDGVRAKVIEHAGHTRLPAYVQGKRGTVPSSSSKTRAGWFRRGAWAYATTVSSAMLARSGIRIRHVSRASSR